MKDVFGKLKDLYFYLEGKFPIEAYAELKRDYTPRDHPVISAGETIRFTMLSRLGDLGWTRDLDQDFGYEARTALDDDSLFTNLRLTRELKEEPKHG